MIEQYKAEGETNVYLTTFSTKATNHGWMDADTAIDTINALKAGGYTNYEDAVKKTVENFESGKPEASRTFTYFIADGGASRELDENGDAVSSDNIKGVIIDGVQYYRFDPEYYNMWQGFTTNQANSMKTTAIGIGDDLSDRGKEYINMMASAYNDEALFAGDNANELTAVFSQEEVIEGNVFNFVESNHDITIDSVTIDGVEYSDSISDVAIDGKGKFTFDFETGEYSYAVKKSEFETDSIKSFGVKVSDAIDNQLEFDVDMHIFTFNPTIEGDAGDDEIIYNPTANIDGGDGYDMLKLVSDQEIDFSDDRLNALTIQNIEQIDMNNGAANTITNLTLDDVLDMTDSKNTLHITGDDQDTLNVDTSGWNLTSSTSSGGVTQYLYSNGVDSITLKIDDQIDSTGL